MVEIALDIVPPTLIQGIPPEEGTSCEPAPRDMHLRVLDGNGQIGAAGVRLSRPLVVQFLEEGEPRGPLSIERDCDGDPGIDLSVKMEVVRFGVSGDATLTLVGGTEEPVSPPTPQIKRVRLPADGLVGVYVTCGSTTEPLVVTASVEVETPNQDLGIDAPVATFVIGAADVSFKRRVSAGGWESVEVIHPARIQPRSEEDEFYIEKRSPLPARAADLVELRFRGCDGGLPPAFPTALPIDGASLSLSFVEENDRHVLYRSPPITATLDEPIEGIASSSGRIFLSGDLYGDLIVRGSDEERRQVAGWLNRDFGLQMKQAGKWIPVEWHEQEEHEAALDAMVAQIVAMVKSPFKLDDGVELFFGPDDFAFTAARTGLFEHWGLDPYPSPTVFFAKLFMRASARLRA